MALFLVVVTSCDSGPKPPAVLQEAQFKNRVVVEAADPLDPESVLFTLHKDGRFTWKGSPQTKEGMIKRAASAEKVNRTPILFEVEPDAPFSLVRDALYVFTGEPQCVNYSFLVDTRTGPGVVVLPMQAMKGFGYHVYEGREKEVHVGKWVDDRQLEVVVSPGKDGAINVAEVNYVVPGTLAFPKLDYGSKPPSNAWAGEHLPCGMWTKDMLRTFLSRADVAERLPFIHFKITNQEPVADVVRCLAMLKSIKGIVIVPSIPTKE